MSSEPVCQAERSWVDVGSFHTRLVMRFMIFTALVRNILDRCCPPLGVELLHTGCLDQHYCSFRSFAGECCPAIVSSADVLMSTIGTQTQLLTVAGILRHYVDCQA
jgi:hypothetical protein